MHSSSVRVDWSEFMAQVEGRRITVLINNVATTFPVSYNPLEAITEDGIEATIRVNSIFPSQLTRQLLPTLMEKSPSFIEEIYRFSMRCAWIGPVRINLTSSTILYSRLFMTVDRMPSTSLTCWTTCTWPVFYRVKLAPTRLVLWYSPSQDRR